MVARGQWIVKLEKLRQCNKCRSYFHDQTTYKKHKEFHRNEKKVEISNDETFCTSKNIKVEEEEEEKKKVKIRSLTYVIQEENSVKTYKCAKCENVYGKKTAVQQHFSRNHRETKFKCHKCGKLYGKNSDLQVHLETCIGIFGAKSIICDDGERFQCIKCQEIFSDKASFCVHHFEVHREEKKFREKKYKCDKCSKKYPFKANLDRHVKVCNGILRTRKQDKKYEMIEINNVKHFQCNKCQETYLDKENIKVHFKSHRKKKYNCDKCNKHFIFKLSLKSHLNVCNGKLTNYEKHKEIYPPSKTKGKVEKVVKSEDILAKNQDEGKKCNECPKSFSSNSTLNRHFRKHHDMDYCSDKLKMKDIEYKEINNSNGKNEFQCVKCEKVYRTRNSIYHHIYIAHLEKKYKCEKCSKMFSFKSKFNAHVQKCDGILRIRNSKKMYQFKDIEHKEINVNDKLKMKDIEYKEINNSNGKKEFQCVKCEKVYGTKDSIYQHIHVAHREKKYKCEKCSKMFSLKSMFNAHVKKCDGILRIKKSRKIYQIIEVEGAKKLKCAKCDKVYEKDSTVYKHFQSTHREKKFKCDKCSKMFPIKSKLKSHELTCKGILRTKSSYHKIIKSDGGEKLQCLKCPDTFLERATFDIHFRQHKDEKCEKCNKMFAFKWHLNIHMKKCDGMLRIRKSKKKSKKANYKIVTNEEGKMFQCIV